MDGCDGVTFEEAPVGLAGVDFDCGGGFIWYAGIYYACFCCFLVRGVHGDECCVVFAVE